MPKLPKLTQSLTSPKAANPVAQTSPARPLAARLASANGSKVPQALPKVGSVVGHARCLKKVCPVCGVMFIWKIVNQVYCSISCREVRDTCLEFRVVIYKDKLTHEGAFLLESVLIDLFNWMGALLTNQGSGMSRTEKLPLEINNA